MLVEPLKDLDGRQIYYDPLPKQRLFHASPCFETMFGGRKGPGKTMALIADPCITQLVLANRYYRKTGIKSKGWALIFRKNYNRLKEIIAKAVHFYKLIDPDAPEYKSADHIKEFSCGYRIEFCHLEGPHDHENYHGREPTSVGIDQVEEIPYEQYVYVRAQIRSTDPCFVNPATWKMKTTANPLGQHAAWVKDYFVAPHRPGMKPITEKYVVSDGRTVERSRIFIPAGMKDNPYLPVDYEASLMSLPDHMRRAYLEGDWDVTVGSYFGDLWNRQTHVIPYEFQPAPHWPIYMGGDWGTRAPACTLFAAIDNDHRIVVLDEIYHPASTGTEFGLEILALMKRRGWHPQNVWGWMDSGAKVSNGSSGPSPWEAMWQLGIQWDEADKSAGSRVAGWTEMRERLRVRFDGKPSIFIRENCENLLRELPNAVADERKPDDIDTKQSDHALDALRYLCSGRPLGTTAAQKADQEVEQWSRIAHAQRSPTVREDY